LALHHPTELVKHPRLQWDNGISMDIIDINGICMGNTGNEWDVNRKSMGYV
jgi:hypothetical protein